MQKNLLKLILLAWCKYKDPTPDPDPFSEAYGSADPDPHQNVMDPQHW